MYKMVRTEMAEINAADFKNLVEIARESIKQGDYIAIPHSKEEKLNNDKLPSHITRIKLGGDIILYSNKYVNLTSNPLATGYFVEVFIKEDSNVN